MAEYNTTIDFAYSEENSKVDTVVGDLITSRGVNKKGSFGRKYSYLRYYQKKNIEKCDDCGRVGIFHRARIYHYYETEQPDARRVLVRDNHSPRTLCLGCSNRWLAAIRRLKQCDNLLDEIKKEIASQWKR